MREKIRRLNCAIDKQIEVKKMQSQIEVKKMQLECDPMNWFFSWSKRQNIWWVA